MGGGSDIGSSGITDSVITPAQTPGVATASHVLPASWRGTGLAGFDPLLMLAGVALLGAGLFTIAGVTRDDVPGSPNYFVTRQAVFGVIGIVAMALMSRIDYGVLRAARNHLYGLLVGSVGLVLLLGASSRGSRRWIDVAGFQIQPSEFGKLLLVIVLASYVCDRARDRGRGTTSVRALLIGAVPAVLVFLQPDLGTALVYGAIVLAILFVAGAHWTHIATILGAVAAVGLVVLAIAPAAGLNVLQPYQVDRLTAFLSPNENPGEQGYQQIQAQIAIGAGQRTGRGFDGATQTKLNFLPEHHTDFVFAVVGESFGFAGAATVLSLYALLLWRVLRIMIGARDKFGTLIAAGIAAILMFQVFVNVGMNIGVMPITGVTLPLMSYGGSSLITTFMALGLLQVIAAGSRTVATNRGRIQTI